MKHVRVFTISLGVSALLAPLITGCTRTPARSESKFERANFAADTKTPLAELKAPTPAPVNPWEKLAVHRVKVSNPIAAKIVLAARAQEGDYYDPSYQSISYPGGDVAAGRGACTDVVIRALRGANIDLQELVHQDMKRDFRAYGDGWKLGRTDKNIDHRRVPNLMTFFARHGKTLPRSTAKADLKTWQPGDVVCWKLPGNLNHIGIVSSGVGARGLPLVIHNAQQCIEQDYLDAWPITGHYRYP